MSEDSRHLMLAAGDMIDVNGKQYRLRAVVAQSLCDLERDALRHYKQQYLSTFADNVDLFNGNGENVLREELTRAASWDLSDLPQKNAYDVSLVPLTPKLKNWAKESFALEEPPTSDAAWQALILHALEKGNLTPDELRDLSGRKPLQGKVRYDQWWVTASTEGMLNFVAASVPELTQEEVGEWPIHKIVEASRLVEALTSVSVGNGQDSPKSGEHAPKRKKSRKKAADSSAG